MPIENTTNTRLPRIRSLSSSPTHCHPPPLNYAAKSPLYNPPAHPPVSDSKPATTTMVTMDDDNISLSLSDEDMLLCCDDDDEDAVWSDESDKHGTTGKNGQDDNRNNSRSRRLLSLEQSKVLYKILEKTHFPSTQLRESVASQLGVSPRKVQVWFQNRRQVGKKRMIEAVQSYLNIGPTTTTNASPPHHVNISLEVLSDTLKATGKGRFSPHEDERTRAWRKHTIRLALNPGAIENNNNNNNSNNDSGIGGGMEDDFESHLSSTRNFAPQQQQPRYVGGGEGVRMSRGIFEEEARLRNRALHSMSRSVGSLRINVPRINHSAGGMLMGINSAKTPTYTGPGSATHLETLTAIHRGLPPLTPAAVRSSIVPPAIVSSQKEVFTLHPHHHHHHHHHHHQQQQQREQHQQRKQQQYSTVPPGGGGGGGGGLRVRSATLAVPVVGVVHGGRDGNGEVNGGEGMREVRGSLTAEWSARQRAYELSTRRQGFDEEQVYHSRSLRGVSSLPHNSGNSNGSGGVGGGGGGGRYRSSPPVEQQRNPHQHQHQHHHHSQSQKPMQSRTPTLDRQSWRERYSPYGRSLNLATAVRQSHGQGQGQGGTLVRTNLTSFDTCSGVGRSRSVSSPHYPSVVGRSEVIRGEREERGYGSQLSHSSSITHDSFSGGVGWSVNNGSSTSTTTPTTAGTSSLSPPLNITVKHETKSSPHREEIHHHSHHRSQQTHKTFGNLLPSPPHNLPSDNEENHTGKDQVDSRVDPKKKNSRWSPMDVRSLTTCTIANTSNSSCSGDSTTLLTTSGAVGST